MFVICCPTVMAGGTGKCFPTHPFGQAARLANRMAPPSAACLRRQLGEPIDITEDRVATELSPATRAFIARTLLIHEEVDN